MNETENWIFDESLPKEVRKAAADLIRIAFEQNVVATICFMLPKPSTKGVRYLAASSHRGALAWAPVHESSSSRLEQLERKEEAAEQAAAKLGSKKVN